MSRLEFLDPQGELDANLALDAMLLVEGPYSADYVSKVLAFFQELNKLELHVIYDWAMREHLAAAGNQVKRREKPGILKLVDQVYEAVTNMERVIREHSSNARIEELEEDNEVLKARIAALESQVEIAGGETPEGSSVH